MGPGIPLFTHNCHQTKKNFIDPCSNKKNGSHLRELILFFFFSLPGVDKTLVSQPKGQCDWTIINEPE